MRLHTTIFFIILCLRELHFVLRLCVIFLWILWNIGNIPNNESKTKHVWYKYQSRKHACVEIYTEVSYSDHSKDLKMINSVCLDSSFHLRFRQHATKDTHYVSAHLVTITKLAIRLYRHCFFIVMILHLTPQKFRSGSHASWFMEHKKKLKPSDFLFSDKYGEINVASLYEQISVM